MSIIDPGYERSAAISLKYWSTFGAVFCLLLVTGTKSELESVEIRNPRNEKQKAKLLCEAASMLICFTCRQFAESEQQLFLVSHVSCLSAILDVTRVPKNESFLFDVNRKFNDMIFFIWEILRGNSLFSVVRRIFWSFDGIFRNFTEFLSI